MYEGQYHEGKKHGRGLYIWQDGSSYDGDWFENRIEGSGVYKWKDGRTTLVEVKPKKQCQPPKTKRPKSKRSLNEAYTWIMNNNKWHAADQIAKDNGWEFRIWTEDELTQRGILKKQPGKIKPMKKLSPYRKKKSTQKFLQHGRYTFDQCRPLLRVGCSVSKSC